MFLSSQFWAHRDRKTSGVLCPANLFCLMSSTSRETLSQNSKADDAPGMTFEVIL